MIAEVAIDPPMLDVKVFTDDESVFGTERFVIVALVAVRFVKKADKAVIRSVKRFDTVAFVIEAFVDTRFVIVAASSDRPVTDAFERSRLPEIVVVPVREVGPAKVAVPFTTTGPFRVVVELLITSPLLITTPVLVVVPVRVVPEALDEIDPSVPEAAFNISVLVVEAFNV